MSEIVNGWQIPLRHGLLRGSFIPPIEIREIRELVRHRHTLVTVQTAVSNRILKVVESANIKLAQVASDALGVSGRAMLRSLADGEQDIAKMSQMARGALKQKEAQLQRALSGRLTRSQRFVLKELLKQLDDIEAGVARVSEEIRQQTEENDRPSVREAVQLLQTIPGVGERVAEVIVSEIGIDMSRFPRYESIPERPPSV